MQSQFGFMQQPVQQPQQAQNMFGGMTMTPSMTPAPQQQPFGMNNMFQNMNLGGSTIPAQQKPPVQDMFSGMNLQSQDR